MKRRAAESTGVWQRTNVQNLLRNSHSGTYYGRFTLAGKQKWFSLRTSVFSVARQRLRVKADEVEQARSRVERTEGGDATMGDLMEVWRERVKQNTDIKDTTKASLLVGLRKVEMSWPRLASRKPASIHPSEVFEWVAGLKAGTNSPVRKDKKGRLRGVSATSVNRAIDSLRHVFEIAIEQGQMFSNPAKAKPRSGRLKKKVLPKKLTLPSNDQIRRTLKEMEANGSLGGWGREAADFCRFLMLTGARLSDARVAIWKDVEWDSNRLHLHGSKTPSADRRIPLFPKLAAFLKALRKRREAAARFRPDGAKLTGPNDPIMLLKTCQETIDGACKRAKTPRFTHHDLRHLFATACIEAGVDTFTISKWLGHGDGGALVQKTYGHLRQEHSDAQARRVRFKI